MNETHECQVCHEDKPCFDWDGWYICHDCYELADMSDEEYNQWLEAVR